MIVGNEIKNIDVDIPKDIYDADKQTPTFSVYLTIIVKDPQGKIIKVHRQRSHSPTANFIGLLLPLTYYESSSITFTLTNTGGETYSYQPGSTSINTYISYPATGYNENQTTNIVMIQVGSGSQSNPYTAYSLASPIANGSGAGQLIYGTPSVSPNVTVNGNSAYFYITQTFNNATSSTVNITEVGILLHPTLINYEITYATNCGQLLVWYDTLSSPISVPAGSAVVIAYTFTVNP